jgi:hypothetical protein
LASIDVSGRSLLQILRGVSDPEQLALDHSGERVFIASEDTGTVVVLGAKDGARLKGCAGGRSSPRAWRRARMDDRLREHGEQPA